MFDDAKYNNKSEVICWGSGAPKREFLYVDDLAGAVIYCLENIEAQDIYDEGISHINCGSEDEVSISELMYIIQDAVDYDGSIVFDKTKPDGTFRKKMDNTRIQNLGYKNTTSLTEGIKKTSPNRFCNMYNQSTRCNGMGFKRVF